MKTAEVTFSGQANLKIVLEEETTQMDEVVVTGIFERKSESLPVLRRHIRRRI